MNLELEGADEFKLPVEDEKIKVPPSVPAA